MPSEFSIIEQLRSSASSYPNANLLIGIGDDCAQLPPNQFDLVTTDTLVDKVHFSTQYMSPEDIGYRTITASLSDVAAMGGSPGPFFTNLSIGPSLSPESFIPRFFRGIQDAIRDQASSPSTFPVQLAGGDITRSPHTSVFSLTLLGSSPPLGPIRRNSAQLHDLIIVTGPLGDSSSGLHIIQSLNYSLQFQDPITPSEHSLIQNHIRPTSLSQFGSILGQLHLPNSMIDSSDGFLQDLGHILHASRLGAVCDLRNFTLSPSFRTFHHNNPHATLEHCVSGGEDYQLILTLPPHSLDAFQAAADPFNLDWFIAGQTVPLANPHDPILLLDSNGLPVSPPQRGFQHFS